MTKVKDKEKSTRIAWLAVCLSFFLVPIISDYVCVIITPVLFFIYKANVGYSLKNVTKTPVTVLFVLFLLYQLINIFRPKYIVSSLGFAVLWIVLFMGFMVVSDCVKTKKNVEQIFYYLTITGGIVGLIGCIEMFLYHYGGYVDERLTYIFNPFWREFHAGVIYIAARLLPSQLTQQFGIDLYTARASTFDTRACSTFSNPLFYAAFLVFIVPVAAHCFFHFKKVKKRIVSLVCLLISLGGLVLSYSRGSYIAVALAIFVTLFSNQKQRKITLCSLPILLLIVPSGVYKRLLTLATNREDISLTTHVSVYQAALQTIQKHWLVGLGTGNQAFEDILKGIYHIGQPHAHNIILEFFVEGGIIGVSLFVAMLVMLFIALIKTAKRTNEGRTVAVTMIASLVGFLFCGMTDYIFYGPKTIQLFMMFTGLAYAITKIKFQDIDEKNYLWSVKEFHKQFVPKLKKAFTKQH